MFPSILEVISLPLKTRFSHDRGPEDCRQPLAVRGVQSAADGESLGVSWCELVEEPVELEICRPEGLCDLPRTANRRDLAGEEDKRWFGL